MPVALAVLIRAMITPRPCRSPAGSPKGCSPVWATQTACASPAVRLRLLKYARNDRFTDTSLARQVHSLLCSEQLQDEGSVCITASQGHKRKGAFEDMFDVEGKSRPPLTVRPPRLGIQS